MCVWKHTYEKYQECGKKWSLKFILDLGNSSFTHHTNSRSTCSCRPHHTWNVFIGGRGLLSGHASSVPRLFSSKLSEKLKSQWKPTGCAQFCCSDVQVLQYSKVCQCTVTTLLGVVTGVTDHTSDHTKTHLKLSTTESLLGFVENLSRNV